MHENKAVTKAIFVVAGSGTRFLPITKAVPKEMLPIVDTPVIQLLVEQAVEAGIEDIIFVTGRGKTSIENHFDKSFELEHNLVEKNKQDRLAQVEGISKLAHFAYVRQPVQLGDGHAILCARPYIHPDEAVLMVFPDYLMPKENNTFKRMIGCYQKHGKTVIGLDQVPMDQTSKYGIIDPSHEEGDEIGIAGFVEKPESNPPSNFINNGYAVLSPNFWNYMHSADSTVSDGEIRVADAYIDMLKADQELFGVKPTQSGYDCGSKFGFLKATVEYALKHPDLEDDFKAYLKDTVEKLD